MSPPSRLRSAIVVVLAALALYAATTHRRVFSAGNDAARWATIESLVDHGRASIERSRFAGTVDQVRLGELRFSNKPPLLALLGAAVYLPLQVVTGWSLAGPGAANVLWFVTVVLVGLPAALLAGRFHLALEHFPALEGSRRWLLTAALAAGTLLWPFATTLNAHVPAAALLFVALLAALDGRAVRSGAFAGFSAALDLLPGAGFVPVFAALLWKRGGGGAWKRFALGLSLPVAVVLVANRATHGSMLPIKLVPGAVDLSSLAGPSVGGVVLPQGAGYLFEILFGGHGLFAVSPVLLFGAVGLLLACRKGTTDGWGDRADWRWLAVGIAAQVIGHALLAGSYGGWSYGYRYLIPVQPVLLFAAPFALSRASSLRPILLGGALSISVLFAALGAYHPWPPGYEQETNRHPVASLVRNPVGGNAAAWLAAQAPGEAVTRLLADRFVSRDPAAARAYFALFFGSKGDLATMERFRIATP